MGATAALVIAAERQVVERLRLVGAVREADAIPLDNLRPLEARRLQRLLDVGAVRKTGDGRYWLDEVKLAGRQRRRRRILGSVLAIVITLFLLGILITPKPLP
jgi:hypothetical protein